MLHLCNWTICVAINGKFTELYQNLTFLDNYFPNNSRLIKVWGPLRKINFMYRCTISFELMICILVQRKNISNKSCSCFFCVLLFTDLNLNKENFRLDVLWKSSAQSKNVAIKILRMLGVVKHDKLWLKDAEKSTENSWNLYHSIKSIWCWENEKTVWIHLHNSTETNLSAICEARILHKTLRFILSF